MDVIGSAVALILLSPIFICIAIAVRIALGNPVLFRQVRPGLYGKPFSMLKFRTMKDAFDEHGCALPDEARLGPFGRFLRSTSLDELPELWNVLVGDMSLVGPRPLLMDYLSLYTDEQRRRHEVRPGITGWAQINGRNAIDWDEKLRLDIWYVDNQSLWLDLKIMIITVLRVLSGSGVAKEGYATTDRFRGSAQE